MIFSSTLTSFALDPKMIFKDAAYYNAKIYVCDTQNKEAVLLGVSPLTYTPGYFSGSELEYKALPITESRIVGADGQKYSMSMVNGYLLDSSVRVLIAKNEYGYKILHMQFLK
ncbi:MAG: hypothetical protein IJE62_04550 [Clostridia bacterium]|nr:hypothetical protein [Clostridia bacterium]